MTRRCQAIIALLSREEEVTVKALADRFQVSLMTIYRDLRWLANEGLIIRTAGGAIISPGPEYGRRWKERVHQQSHTKARLGAVTAGMLQDGETVIFDAGTTVLEVARHLIPGRHLITVTNSLPTAATLQEHEHVIVIMPGGQLYPDVMSLLGASAMKFFEDVHADTLVLSASAVSIAQGLMNASLDLAVMERVMLQQAQRVILVTDYTKFQRFAKFTVSPIQSVDYLVCDDRMPFTVQKRLEEQGIHVKLVPMQSSLKSERATPVGVG